MSNIKGKVEVVMTNKFDAEKIALKLEGDDTWYGQKKEFMEVVPNRGDVVEFSGGKTGKYIQYLKVLESAAPAAAPAAKGKAGGGFNALGVELGHAANNAVQLCIASGDLDLSTVKALTKDFYEMMRDLRSEYEGTEVVQEKAPKVSVSKAKAKPAPVEDVEDDDPF